MTLDTHRHIPSLTTDTILSLSVCAVAKWLRDHDPPAPWDHRVCDSVIAAGAKAAGFNIMMDSERSGEKSKEYKAGDPALA